MEDKLEGKINHAFSLVQEDLAIIRKTITLCVKNQAKLDFRLNRIEKDFAQMRLDLKSAMILHDEPYSPPPIDELSPGGKKPSTVKSKKLKKLEKEGSMFGQS